MADKRSQVHMLPTEDKHSDFPIIKEINSEELHTMVDGLYEHEDFIAQHLYFTTDEDIKVGDYYTNGKNIFKCKSLKDVEPKRYYYLRKVVATTDKSLRIHDIDNDGYFYLPQPSQAFIEKYCQVGGIDTVLIEYITQEEGYCCNCSGGSDKSFKCTCNKGKRLFKVNKLKVDSHNTITIHPIKSSWTKEEVMNFGLFLGEQFKKQYAIFPKLSVKTQTIDSLFDQWNNL